MNCILPRVAIAATFHSQTLGLSTVLYNTFTAYTIFLANTIGMICPIYIYISVQHRARRSSNGYINIAQQ